MRAVHPVGESDLVCVLFRIRRPGGGHCTRKLSNDKKKKKKTKNSF